jgi:hypothetical protein
MRVVHATGMATPDGPCWLLGCAFDEPLADADIQALR